MGRRILLSCIFTVSVLLPGVLLAQTDFMKTMRSPMARRAQQAGAKAAVHSMWNGNMGSMMAIQLVDEPEIREAWGISEEQHQKIKGVAADQSLFMKHPEFPKIVAEMQKFMDPTDPMMEKADEERMKGFLGAQEKLMTLAMDVIPAEIDKTLTDEQKVKMKEFQLSIMSESPMVTPNTFEALGLSEEQKKQLEGIKKKMEPDFEKVMGEVMEAQFRNMDKIYDMLDKEGGEIKDVKTFQEKLVAAAKKLNETDEAVKKENEELKKKARAFTTRLRFEMYDVLTDEQMAKLEQLVDHPPEYVAKFLKKIKERFGQQGQADPSQSMMDVWKPGEAIPEEYKQKRKRKSFPVDE